MQSTLDYGTKSNTIQLKFKTLDSHWLSSSSFKCRFFPSLFFIYFFLFLYGMMNFFLFFPSSNKKTAFKTVLLFTKQIKTFFFTARKQGKKFTFKVCSSVLFYQHNYNSIIYTHTTHMHVVDVTFIWSAQVRLKKYMILWFFCVFLLLLLFLADLLILCLLRSFALFFYLSLSLSIYICFMIFLVF